MRSPKIFRSFHRAFLGLKVGYQDPMMWRHTITTIAVIFCSIYYKLSPEQLAIVILCCGAVLGLELLNTGIEKLAKEHQNPRPALDVSATGVLIMSMAAMAVGLLFILPKAIPNPWVLIICAILIPFTWMVVN